MQLPPPSVLAQWPNPNYIDPVNRGKANVVINFTLFPLAFIFLILRVYTRLRISKSFGLDDVFILLALIPTTGFFILALVIDIHFNVFRHTWDIPLPVLSTQLQTNIAAECLFGAAFLFTKLSILQLLRRILARSTNRIRLIISISMGLCVLEAFALILSVVFQCTPVSAYWTLSVSPQHCISEKFNLLAADVINTCTDLLVVLLPLALIWNLNIPVRQLLVVSFLFALGFVVLAAGIYRTFMFYRLGDAYDKTWIAYYVYLATEIELYTGVLCASILPTQPLFVKLFPAAYKHFISSEATKTDYKENTYHASVAPTYQITAPKSAISKQKQRRKISSITDRSSRINIEDEILVQYEDLPSPDPSMDLESGLFWLGSHTSSPKKARSRSGSKGSKANTSRPNSTLLDCFLPGRREDESRLESPSPVLQHSISQRIRYLKAPHGAKLVRLDVENPQIRMITPDSDWDTSNASSSKRGSVASAATIVSTSSKGIKIGKRRLTMGVLKSDEKESGRIVSVSSAGSGISSGSGVIGIAVSMENLASHAPPPTPPPKDTINFSLKAPSPTPITVGESSTKTSKKTVKVQNDIRDYRSEATETINRASSPRAEFYRHPQRYPSTRSARSTRSNTVNDVINKPPPEIRGEGGGASPGARTNIESQSSPPHIAELMDVKLRDGGESFDMLRNGGESFDMLRDGVSFWRASKLSSLSSGSMRPRGDSPTLSRGAQNHVLHSIRRAMA